MKYVYVARMPNDGGPMARMYVLKEVELINEGKTGQARVSLRCRLSAVDPPVLRRKSGGHFEWDYANDIMSTRDFHWLYPAIRLKPGEGPILTDLHDVSKKRTSKDPDS